MSIRSRITQLSNNVYEFVKDNRYKCVVCNSVFAFNDENTAKNHLTSIKHRGFEALETVAILRRDPKIAPVPGFQ